MPIQVIEKTQPEADMQPGLDRIYQDYPGYEWDSFCEIWGKDDHQLFAAFFNGKWIAAIMAQRDGDLARLDFACVHDATRRRGVGTDLLDRTVTLLKGSGINRLETRVGNIPEGYDFFTSQGFSGGENDEVLVRFV